MFPDGLRNTAEHLEHDVHIALLEGIFDYTPQWNITNDSGMLHVDIQVPSQERIDQQQAHNQAMQRQCNSPILSTNTKYFVSKKYDDDLL